MTDRELLELAAKAVAIEATAYYGAEDEFFGLVANATGAEWNPLTDDGDALRLAVDGQMALHLPHWDIWAETKSKHHEVGDDKYAAARRAIVCAAAEIGKHLKEQP